MRGSHLRLVVSALLALVAVATGCSSPAAEPEGAGGSCSGAACGGGGSGGDPGRCPDLSGTGSCRAAGGCPSGSECTLGSRICAEDRCCTLPFSCKPVVGLKPGGFLCDGDDECTSGECLEVRFDLKVCLRACNLTSGGDSCPLGSTCQVVPLTGAASVRACLGGEQDAPVPEQTNCRADRDCVEGRVCRILGGERLVWDHESSATLSGGAQPVCLPPAAVHDNGEGCAPEPPVDAPDIYGFSYSASCEEGGLCQRGCVGGNDRVCECLAAEISAGSCRGLLCTGPCRGDGDCPNRMVCTLPEGDRFVHEPPDLIWGFCQWPSPVDVLWGCYDELDCCKDGKRPDGLDCCEVSARDSSRCYLPPAPEPVTYCRTVRSGTRFTTECGRPEGKTALGAACATDAECESALCVPDGAGASFCSSPCLARVDRCEQILPGTSCCATPSGDLCLEACRADCEATPACALRP